jgi:hypothetical protein
VLFVPLAVLAAVGCYKKEEPAGVDDGGLATETDAVDGTMGDDAGTGDDGGSNPTVATAEDSSPDGGSDDDDSDSDTSSDGSELEPLIGALCDWEFRCCSDGERDYRLGPFTTDAPDCTARFIEQLHSNDDIPELQRGDLLSTLGYAVRLDRSSPNADAAAECKDIIDQQQCWEPYEPGGYCSPASDPIRNPCDFRNLFTGTQSIGEPCSEALALLGYDIECEPGSSCEQVDGDWVCVDKGLVDEFCEANNKCDQGLFCDIASGRCANRSDESEHCEFEDPSQPDIGTESVPCLEHLTCDPESETCKAFCTEAFDCVDDSSCPEGHSCIPVDYDDHTYTYCLARGSTNGDRCDTDRDCVDSMHCEGDSCRTDVGEDDPCTAPNECEGGLYCAGVCTVVVNANQPCNADIECNPSTTIGCITSDDGRRCRTTLLGNGDVCAPGEKQGSNWCTSGVCEDVSEDGIANPECHLGADVGDACDESDATDDTPRCASGLYCDDDVCKLKSDAGGTCHADQGLQCLNGQCDQVWEGDYCTDAVPTGATDVVTCDGQD